MTSFLKNLTAQEITLLLLWLLPLQLIASQPYSQKDLNEERVISSLWQQESPEFTALVYQTYNFAFDSLPELLQNTPKGKKPAIVIDIDDTLLDSADYFSSLIGTDNSRTMERSSYWWQNKLMPAMPGARDFLIKANDAGVEIFYISGRFNHTKTASFNNLKKTGFPISSEDQLLFQNADNLTVSKESKRASIRDKGFHILMLIGDQLEDLGPATNASLPQKRHWLYNNQQHLGKDWFYIPNLIYGSWETTVNGNLTRPTLAEQHAARITALKNSFHADITDPHYAKQSMYGFLWQYASAESDASALQTFNRIDQVIGKLDRTQISNPALTITLNGSVLEYMPATPSPDKTVNGHKQWLSQLFSNSKLVAGVRDSLVHAKNQGYDIFYIADTGLSSMVKEKPELQRQQLSEKLEQLGLPDPDSQHVLLSGDHCPKQLFECSTDYKTRALSTGRHDNRQYTLVLQIGNLISDFESLNTNDKEQLAEYKELYGRQYFLIPNPLHHHSLKRAVDTKHLSDNNLTEIARLRREKAKAAFD